MKGKKLMAMLMAGSLLLAGLTGCGGGSQQSAPEQRQKSAEIHGGIVFCFR